MLHSSKQKWKQVKIRYRKKSVHKFFGCEFRTNVVGNKMRHPNPK